MNRSTKGGFSSTDLPHVVAKTILLFIDGEASVAEGFQKISVAENMEIRLSMTGHDGLQELNAKPADVVILETQLPDMDGMAVLREIRCIASGPIVVILTAHPHIDTIHQAMRLGAYDYITKPVRIGFVLDILREALASRCEG